MEANHLENRQAVSVLLRQQKLDGSLKVVIGVQKVVKLQRNNSLKNCGDNKHKKDSDIFPKTDIKARLLTLVINKL